MSDPIPPDVAPVILDQSLRFYPAHIPCFEGEPSRLDFAIRRVDETVGEGLVALRDFAVGERVFAFTGVVMDGITQYTLQLPSGRHIDDPYFMGKSLHHCDPNCRADMTALTFTAVRPIRAGDFITIDYDHTEDRLFKPFDCNCDAVQCRGVIAGRLVTVKA